MAERSLSKRQLERLRMKERDQAWMVKDSSAPGHNPKDAREFEKRPKQLAKKAVVFLGSLWDSLEKCAYLSRQKKEKRPKQSELERGP